MCKGENPEGVCPVENGRDPLLSIKKDLDNLVGEKVKITANKGRRQVVEREGTLEGTYPSLFVVRLEGDSGRRVSYTYVDVLTEMVKLSLNNSGGEKILKFPVNS